MAEAGLAATPPPPREEKTERNDPRREGGGGDWGRGGLRAARAATTVSRAMTPPPTPTPPTPPQVERKREREKKNRQPQSTKTLGLASLSMQSPPIVFQRAKYKNPGNSSTLKRAEYKKTGSSSIFKPAEYKKYPSIFKRAEYKNTGNPNTFKRVRVTQKYSYLNVTHTLTSLSSARPLAQDQETDRQTRPTDTTEKGDPERDPPTCAKKAIRKWHARPCRCGIAILCVCF